MQSGDVDEPPNTPPCSHTCALSSTASSASVACLCSTRLLDMSWRRPAAAQNVARATCKYFMRTEERRRKKQVRRGLSNQEHTKQFRQCFTNAHSAAGRRGPNASGSCGGYNDRCTRETGCNEDRGIENENATRQIQPKARRTDECKQVATSGIGVNSHTGLAPAEIFDQQLQREWPKRRRARQRAPRRRGAGGRGCMLLVGVFAERDVQCRRRRRVDGTCRRRGRHLELLDRLRVGRGAWEMIATRRPRLSRA